jgi:hypothetical protein
VSRGIADLGSSGARRQRTENVCRAGKLTLPYQFFGQHQPVLFLTGCQGDRLVEERQRLCDIITRDRFCSSKSRERFSIVGPQF